MQFLQKKFLSCDRICQSPLLSWPQKKEIKNPNWEVLSPCYFSVCDPCVLCERYIERSTRSLKTKWQDSWSLPRLPMLNPVSLLDWARIFALNRERLRALHFHLMIRSYTWAFLPGKMGETSKHPLQEFSGFREGEETGCDFLNVIFFPMDEPKRRQTHVFNASIPKFVIPQFAST